jgi:uncharacterized protein (DUF58 family)
MAQRYRVRITPSGYIYIVVTIILSVGAVNTGNNLLYIMSSLLLALMAISGMTSLANLLFMDITITPPREIFAGLPARFRLGVHKKKGRSFFLTGTTPFGTVQMPFIRGTLQADFWLTLPERGITRIETLVLQSGFPLGFFRRSRTCAVSLDVLVYPNPSPLVLPTPQMGQKGYERGASLQGELGDEIRELRGYRVSDPLKWVDWKATARKGEMVARDFYRLQGDTLVFDLSKKGGNWERKVSEACHLIIEGEKNRLLTVLVLPDRVMGPGRGAGHKRLLLEALALA